jgi:chemotaxis protein MotB
VLFDKHEPQSPINRRISIVVMTKQAEEAALKTDVAPQTPPESASNAGASNPTMARPDQTPPVSLIAPAPQAALAAAPQTVAANQ